ncbi:flavonol synthase/flavanone 3-hydroxylase [Melanogaster broomeanus]|nr:flavonol synthase/flavanone 3-hydroxylase [Melanogaster broomeanus]
MEIPTGNTVQDSPLPIIDFANFGDGTSSEAFEISKKLFEACQGVGFAYLINTGIPQSQVDDMFAWSKAFFDLPPDVKKLAPHPKEGWKHRGYSAVGVEQVSQMVFDPSELAAIRKSAPDFKESFDIGREENARIDNIWLPDSHLPGFREVATSFFNTCRAFQMSKLMRALALGLNLPGNGDFLEKYHQEGENQLRLLHYPAAPAEVFARGQKGRIGAHTDFGTATLLFQDDVGGLEVESPRGSGQFISAPPTPGALVFNIGDCLMRWSNDTLKSTLHRVGPCPHDGMGMVRERFSIPFFMSADSDVLIDCLPGCWDESRPKKYEPVTAQAYIDMRLNATY